MCPSLSIRVDPLSPITPSYRTVWAQGDRETPIQEHASASLRELPVADFSVLVSPRGLPTTFVPASVELPEYAPELASVTEHAPEAFIESIPEDAEHLKSKVERKGPGRAVEATVVNTGKLCLSTEEHSYPYMLQRSQHLSRCIHQIC